ncbi:MAG: helix-turn-helix transcriptional regulator, partial [Bacteroidota bacterium]
MSIIGKNIKTIRTIKHISQADFADIFDISRASIGAYEEGRADPK